MAENIFEELEKSSEKPGKKLDWEKLLHQHRYSMLLLLLGAILVGFGAFLLKDGWLGKTDDVQVLNGTTLGQSDTQKLVVEISGSVERPDVYQLEQGSRVEDLLVAAGGLSQDADRNWVEKTINRAAKLSDGQKIFIPSINEQSSDESANIFDTNSDGNKDTSAPEGNPININTASATELETLWGIGPVYAQNIIEHRPYSSTEELVTKKVIKQNVYDRNKDLLTVY